jgi:hypothetical protein
LVVAGYLGSLGAETDVLESHFVVVTLEALAGAIALLNLYVTIRVCFYGGASVSQKIWQMVVVWLIPIIGAVLVHSIIAPPQPVKKDRGFTEGGGENPPSVGLGGPH